MRIAVLDTETTGLPLHPSVALDKQPRIIELAMRVVDESGPTADSLTFLANPGQPLEEVITKITGLTDEDLADEPPFNTRLDDVQTFLNRCDGLAAHNLPFDSFLLWLEVRRAGREKDWVWPEVMFCSTQYFQPQFGYRPKLTQLYQFITGQKLAQTHRALDDVDALCEIIHASKVHKTLSATPPALGVYLPEDIRAARIAG